MAKDRGVSVHPPSRLHLRGLMRFLERTGSRVSHPTVHIDYANRCSPSFKICFAAFTSLSWTAPHIGQVRSRTDKSLDR